MKNEFSGNELLEKVKEILTEVTEVREEQIAADSSLTADLGLSSLDVINIVVEFEERFGISIPDEDIWEFATVGDILVYLEARL